MSEQRTRPKLTEVKFWMNQVAEMLGVHRSTISRLLDAGKLGYYQIGDPRIVAESHLREYLSLAARKANAKTIY